MIEVPLELEASVRDKIRRDLHPSLRVVYLKSGLATVFGGALSLLVCGQFGVGVTHAAMHWNREMHGHVSDLASAVACGIVFAILPPFLLRLFCSPLQFRVITRRSAHAVVVWLVGLGAVLSHYGQSGLPFLEFVLWSAATIGTFLILSRAAERIPVVWKLKASPRS